MSRFRWLLCTTQLEEEEISTGGDMGWQCPPLPTTYFPLWLTFVWCPVPGSSSYICKLNFTRAWQHHFEIWTPESCNGLGVVVAVSIGQQGWRWLKRMRRTALQNISLNLVEAQDIGLYDTAAEICRALHLGSFWASSIFFTHLESSRERVLWASDGVGCSLNGRLAQAPEPPRQGPQH